MSKAIVKKNGNGNKKKPVIIDNDPLGEGEAPEQRELAKMDDFMQLVVSEEQFNVLYARTPKYAIKSRPGGGGRAVKYVPHGYVEDRINKAFGGDWDFYIVPDAFGGQPYDLKTVQFDGAKKSTQYITVLGELKVRVRNPKDLSKVITEVTKREFGSAVWNTEIEFGDALKSASSDAFKRCGLRLGIALDLYYDDDAELRKHEDKLKKEKELAQELLRNQNDPEDVPDNFVGMLTKAQSILGFNATDVCRIIQMELDQLPAAFDNDGENIWKKLVKESKK